MTDAQIKAVKWLRDRNGDGMFDKNSVAMAAGESAPFMRSTWNALRDLGYIEFYNPIDKGRGRLRLTPKAEEIAP